MVYLHFLGLPQSEGFGEAHLELGDVEGGVEGEHLQQAVVDGGRPDGLAVAADLPGAAPPAPRGDVEYNNALDLR